MFLVHVTKLHGEITLALLDAREGWLEKNSRRIRGERSASGGITAISANRLPDRYTELGVFVREISLFEFDSRTAYR